MEVDAPDQMRHGVAFGQAVGFQDQRPDVYALGFVTMLTPEPYPHPLFA